MSRIVWDEVGKRFYETGVKNAVLYKQADNGTYPKGVAWNGITAINENPSGAEATPLWADDIKYIELRSAEEFGATIEAYMSPEEFDECDGCAEVADGMTIGQQNRRPFGLVYKTTLGNDVKKNDYGYKLQIIYNATASPSGKNYQTINDSPEAMTLSWEVSTIPVAVKGYKPTATVEIDSTKADATKLKALEDVLFGTDGDGTTEGTVARLPLPDEIKAILTGTPYVPPVTDPVDTEDGE